MRAVRVTAHGLLRSDVLVRYDKEVTRSKDIQSEDIEVVSAVELLAPAAIAYLEVVGVVLLVGCALDLDAEQDAVIVQNKVIRQEVADGYRDPEATA